MYLSFKLHVLVGILTLLIVSTATANAVSLKQIIEEEFFALKNSRQGDSLLQDCELVFISEGVTRALNKKVLINLSQLSSFTKGVSLNAQRGFCRFVIAHELAHVIHYKFYKERFEKYRGEYALFLECQADLLGAELVGELLLFDYYTKTPKDKVLSNDKRYIIEFTEQYLDGFFDQIIKLGDEDASFNGRTHPRPEQRALAAKKGLIMGLILSVQKMQYTASTEGQYIPIEQTVVLDSFIQKSSKSIGYRPDFDFLFWTHEAAQKIVHVPRKNCPDILIEDVKIIWDESKPPVRYSFIVKNRGEKRLNINFDVSMIICDRKEPNNIVLWDFIAIDSYNNIELDKGQSQEFYGTLTWEATTTRMPRLILPSSDEGTYNIIASEGQAFDSLAIPAIVGTLGSINNVDAKSIADFLMELSLVRNRYNDYIMGIGEVDSEKRFIYYPSPFSSQATTPPVFREDNGKIALTFSLAKLYNIKDARTLSLRIGQALKEKVAMTGWQTEFDENGRGLTLYDLQHSKVLEMKLVEYSTERVSMHFIIHAKGKKTP